MLPKQSYLSFSLTYATTPRQKLQDPKLVALQLSIRCLVSHI